MKFLKILLGLFLMIVGVLNAQNAPTLYNIPEYKQICFNNSLISTKQPVFLISYNNGPYNAIQVEINDKADFTGTAVTQNFTGTYSAGVKVHIAFTNDFSPVAGTTYYVRIKISTNGGSSWGNWTSQNHSFTYKDEGLTEWQQTTQKQFQEASISAALEAKADGSVSFASFTPANPFTNPSFETGAGWNVIRSGNWYSAGLSTGDGVGSMPTNGDKCINLYPSNPGSYGYFSGDYVGVTQQVDLTGLKQFTVDIAAWHSVPRFLTQDNHTHMQLRVIIGNAGTINDKSGTTLSPTFNCPATGGNTASWSKQTFDVSAYQGIYVVKIISFVIYATSGTNDEDNFYLDNIYSATEAPIAGTLSSPAVYLNSFYNASGWDKLKWSQTLNSGNIVLKIQKNNGGSWEDIAGYDNISAAGNGLQEFDISALGQESQLRLFATLTNASTPPVLYDWSLSAKIDCYAPILNVVADKAAACKGETIMLASNPDGGDLCNGNWLYSWFDGNKYWNGAAFAADEAIADVSYQDITITNFTASTTYKATVSCSLLSDCKAEKAVSVTLLDPPSIKQQPAALTLCPGEKGTFTVDAESSTPLTYQWYKNDIIIDGATNIQYSISNTLYADTGFYYCKVSNKCGDSLSLKVKLKLNKTLEFILKLTAQSKCEGDTVTFKVMLTGTEPLTYRWKFNNIEINGATNDSLTLYSLSKQENEGIYSCDISNICSKLNTEAFLTVNTPPLLSTIALNQSKCVGESIEYSLSPNGTEPFGFQWKKDNIDIPGASDSRFSIINIQLPDTGQYSCVVQNLCGTTLAEVANLTINPLPYFSLGRDTVISTEDTLVLAGELQKTYLWNDNSTNSTLTITGPLTEPGTYIYSLTVTDNNGCSAADTIQVAVSFIENKFNISGKVTYNNKVETPMRDTKLILINEAGEKVDSVITNNDGSYLFEKVKKGFYTISATTTMKWGGSNPIDALLINRKFLGMYSFIDKLCEKAADVNNDKTANPIDALFINRRFINIIKKFPVSDWIFENIEFNVINSDIELNIKSICAGDVNRSYPSN